MRLGEAMVREGLITNNTLARALERQIIFGGRLGTNLVEMGAIPEENLAKFLGKVLGVPYASPEQFEDVPQEALDAFPAEMARKYTAFPIKKERSRLHLAMKDPNDISVIDELRFILGLDVRGCIASELRILYALEKYYDIKRDLRYIEVARTEESDNSSPPAAEPARPAPAIPAAPPGPVNAAAGPGNPYASLASPADREEIAEAVVAAAKASLARAALFMVRGNAVTCWKTSGFGDSGEARIELDGPSVFKDVVEEKMFYKGPVLEVPRNMPLLDLLGGAAPLEAIAYPLIIKGKVVGVLYGDDGEGSMIKTDVQGLVNLMAKASMSLEILILRNKILS